eukprot:483050_1
MFFSIVTFILTTVFSQDLGITVFKPGEGNYPCIRIPSITSTPSGTLVAFAECRGWIGDGCQPTQYINNITVDTNLRWVCQKISKDQGKTWSDLSFPVGLNFTSMEPTIVYDNIKNKLILHVNVFLGEPNETIYQVTSIDDGKTWSKPIDIGHLYLGSDANLIIGPGNALQLLNNPNSKYYGRILFIGYKENPNVVRIYYSDNFGETYTLSETILENMSESSLAELSNGSVVANMRLGKDINWNCKCRGIAMSNDGGSTFTAPYADYRLSSPVCEGSIMTMNNGSILLFSNPSNTQSRINMTVHKSIDNGVSWIKEYLLCPKCGAAYSDLTLMKENGYFGLLWETNISKCNGPSCQTMFSVIPANF